jgi:twitching motility protein PilT
MKITEYLEKMVKLRASDLHLKAPTGPVFRVDGNLIQSDCGIMPEEVEAVFRQIATESQQHEFYETNELDCCYSVAGLARFRVSVHRQRGTLDLVFRLIPFKVPTIDELNLPQIFKELIMVPRGLIIVAGPTGSGKSTTLAALVQYLNSHCKKSVITIEDPIEYLYSDDQCIISQRELGADTQSFAAALKHALRHDPNVIVVGEMRDLETVSTALAAAETGHLVLGTLHTIDAAQTVDRLIDVFPPSQHHQVRLQFSQIIEAVICQALLPRLETQGRVGAFEIMTGSAAVRNLIREGKTFELGSIIQLSHNAGMQTLDQDLAVLVQTGQVAEAEAMLRTGHRERLKKLIEQSPAYRPEFAGAGKNASGLEN